MATASEAAPEARSTFPARVAAACRGITRGLSRRLPGGDGDDIGQAAAVELLRRQASLERCSAAELAAYAWRTARSLISETRDTARRRQRREQAWAGTRRQCGTRCDGLLESPECAAIVREELARLPCRLREVVILCDLEGMTHLAASERLGVPVGTVKTRHARALTRLQGARR